MQGSVSMHKSPTPVRHSRMNQARSEEEEKERKRDRKDRGQEADGNKGSPPPPPKKKKKKAYLGTARVNKAVGGGGTPNFPYPQNATPYPLIFAKEMAPSRLDSTSLSRSQKKR